LSLGFFIGMILAYLLGSIPSGVIVGKKIKGIDIRKHGSKNSGATNALRVLGAKLGLLVLLSDILKGAIPVIVSQYLLKVEGIYLVIIGIMAIIGHILSIFLKFKGGKGVATSLGVFIVLSPKSMIIIILLFIAIVLSTRYVSLGSITCAFVYPILTFVIYGNAKIEVVLLGILVAVYIIYKHKTNIKRLMNGQENKIKLKKE